ncbi:hypothetical protein [Deinococcus cellulosilyticus]|uniref:Uncharacterized protein n=1 Tax=Deinococcus cellulosilyticus (strain DSM 18568 / NBRC 106333 / KACC 11606 / 5516J-15) TaxID=1223518 RepID=A0A511N9X7_DEIC1|nr:hypothetical protein [Deinococcus cellulosilyticus]GEM49634.1 hypothetical protein DC3_52690 [Deinococcus cellulosilyticus NBRC 106333 = KACC 11606]
MNTLKARYQKLNTLQKACVILLLLSICLSLFAGLVHLSLMLLTSQPVTFTHVWQYTLGDVWWAVFLLFVVMLNSK